MKLNELLEIKLLMILGNVKGFADLQLVISVVFVRCVQILVVKVQCIQFYTLGSPLSKNIVVHNCSAFLNKNTI